MPLKLVPPRTPKTPNWSIRGTYLGVAVDRSARTPKKAVAERELKKLEGKIERGEYPEKPKPKNAASFLSAAVAYMKDGGSRRYVGKLIDYFGETALPLIDQDAIDEAASTLYPNVTAATRNGCVHTPVSAILHHAGVKITVRRPKGYKEKTKTLFLLPDDAFAIIGAANAIDAEMGRLLSFLLYTGCRIGEALALKWERVSLDDRTAYIETSKNDDPRTVRLTEELCSLLEPHRKAAGKVFRFHQGGHRNFIFLNAKVTACGTGCAAEAWRADGDPALSLFVGDVPHVLSHLGDVDAEVRGRRSAGPRRHRPLARRAARRYTHTAAHEEWSRVDSLPVSGKIVDLPRKVRKAKAFQ